VAVCGTLPARLQASILAQVAVDFSSADAEAGKRLKISLLLLWRMEEVGPALRSSFGPTFAIAE
jgi:hypothetical protein